MATSSSLSPKSAMLSSVSSSQTSLDRASGSMGYTQTLMYGQYSKALSEFAKMKSVQEQERLERVHRHRGASSNVESGALLRRQTPLGRVVTLVWSQTFAKIGEDWVFLAVLGVLMACVSFAMDLGIESCVRSRLYLYSYLSQTNLLVRFVAWTTLPVLLVLFSASFVHVVAPQAIGSGIPEMKTILRGVVLKEYLSLRTLIAKIVGLTATLGSGMPLGKEGPFVHIASIVATCLSRLITSFQGIYANESRNSEMLAAACAVGVACCFGSPVGGVLFSIEVTSVYFAVRNYWRGFFAAVCGAMTFRLLAIWFEHEETIVAVFVTGFTMEFPYDPQEIFVFALIGVFCGIGGALYVYLHRKYVLWMRANVRLNNFLRSNRFLYPMIVASLISTLSFPQFTGQFAAGAISTHEQIEILFSNFTWTRDDLSVAEWHKVQHWVTPYTSIFVNLFIYILATFFLSILAATLPVPTGVLIPTFKVGAAFGRLVGEAMHVWFPDGVRYGSTLSFIMPGGYATVGAAAFSGAVTHTISISVIVFEMTGQITHCIPVLIAVLIANAIAQLLQPSCYDSIIMIKKLPYLPDILPSSSGAYHLYVDDFMLRDVHYIWHGITYRELSDILMAAKKIKGFPLVDNPTSMVLLGSIQRSELVTAMDTQIGIGRRIDEARLRFRERMEQRRRQLQRAEILRQMEEEEEIRRKLLEEREALRQAKEGSKESNEEDSNNKSPQRKPSRFEVTTSSGAKFVPDAKSEDESASSSSAVVPSTKPKKSILKKSHHYAHTIHAFDSDNKSGGKRPKDDSHSTHSANFADELGAPNPSSLLNNDRTVTGVESRRGSISKPTPLLRGLFFRRHSLDDLSNPNNNLDVDNVDLEGEERSEWESKQLNQVVDFGSLKIDPAPFQLVEKTSLLKVHSLFSMLSVNLAYVTAIGRLIGVVGLKELRKAIEDANAGVRDQQISRRRNAVNADSSDSSSENEDENLMTKHKV